MSGIRKVTVFLSVYNRLRIVLFYLEYGQKIQSRHLNTPIILRSIAFSSYFFMKFLLEIFDIRCKTLKNSLSWIVKYTWPNSHFDSYFPPIVTAECPLFSDRIFLSLSMFVCADRRDRSPDQLMSIVPMRDREKLCAEYYWWEKNSHKLKTKTIVRRKNIQLHLSQNYLEMTKYSRRITFADVIKNVNSLIITPDRCED